MNNTVQMLSFNIYITLGSWVPGDSLRMFGYMNTGSSRWSRFDLEVIPHDHNMDLTPYTGTLSTSLHTKTKIERILICLRGIRRVGL